MTKTSAARGLPSPVSAPVFRERDLTSVVIGHPFSRVLGGCSTDQRRRSSSVRGEPVAGHPIVGTIRNTALHHSPGCTQVSSERASALVRAVIGSMQMYCSPGGA